MSAPVLHLQCRHISLLFCSCSLSAFIELVVFSIKTCASTSTYVHPSGTARGSTKALRECRAAPWRVMVRRVQTRPKLAEENRRDLSAGSQQDQEYVLRLEGGGGLELKTSEGLWQPPVKQWKDSERKDLVSTRTYHSHTHTQHFLMFYQFANRNSFLTK